MSLLSTLTFALIPAARKWSSNEEEITRLKEENAQLRAEASYWRTACHQEMQWRQQRERHQIQQHAHVAAHLNQHPLQNASESYCEHLRNCTPGRGEYFRQQMQSHQQFFGTIR